MDHFPHGVDVRQRIAVRAQGIEHGTPLRKALVIWNVYHGRDFPLQAAIPRVLKHAHNLHVARRSAIICDDEAPSERILPGEIDLRESLINNCNGLRPGPVTFLNVAPGKDGHLHCREEFGSDNQNPSGFVARGARQMNV